MTSLKFNKIGDLELVYDLSGDSMLDFDIEQFLIEAEFIISDKNDSQIIYIFPKTNDKIKYSKIIKYTLSYISKNLGSKTVSISESIRENLQESSIDHDQYKNALELGRKIKDKDFYDLDLPHTFKRTLKSFQKQSVAHLLTIGNGANFSVPGSGKTTIAYAALSKWLADGQIEKIMVIGPSASFGPWIEEYESCFGVPPKSLRVHGEITKHITNMGNNLNLLLLHYQTSNTRLNDLIDFLNKFKTALIIDESHNIKNFQGKWASSALQLAAYAEKRIILSGTPMPNNTEDLWSQITFLWPNNFPLGNQNQYNFAVKKKGLDESHKQILYSLFCRIKKKDLKLPNPEFLYYDVEMKPVQREIYNAIAAKTLNEIENSSRSEQLHKFRTAKMIRLLQTASNPSLLHEMSSKFYVDHDLFNESFGLEYEKLNKNDIIPSLDIYDKIKNYSKMEIPRKLVTANKIARKIINKGNKVVIWSTFLLNMEIFRTQLLEDLSPIIINGSVSRYDDEVNRDTLIEKFKTDPSSQILIATPASLGESVSLHKNIRGENVCFDAIYLDRNYHGAQFMQSIDRIHRIGMDEDLTVQYHILVGKHTIDEKINIRLNEKWNDMMRALNDELNFDMKIESQSENEFERDYQELVKHLRSLNN